MGIFIPAFWLLLFVCALLYVINRANPVQNNAGDGHFALFQKKYLLVYLLAAGADWLQGPHVYALYDSYGMTTHQIQILFVAGFGSSLCFGTLVGSFADKYGRKANCFLYAILYGLSCITKHFPNFWILMLGRLLGGIATSILYSAFESWLIREHNAIGYKPELLGTVFSNAVLGNSIVAIIAGVLAQYGADAFGFVAPFDISLCTLVLMCIALGLLWTENYGDQTNNLTHSFKSAFHSIKSDPRILYLGLIQSLFEGSMYTFVLEWTPALTPPVDSQHNTSSDGHRGSIPHGYIFACFMVAIMIGSSLFKLASKSYRIESFMVPVLLTASLSLGVPVLCTDNRELIFIAFLIFETCVGMFWPALSTMRGTYVPEETRATVMNCFRIPLNLIVVCILLQNLHMTTIFCCCVTFLLAATILQYLLYSYTNQEKKEDIPV